MQLRQAKGLLNSILFFIMIIVFFPLSMPSDTLMLKQIAPGLIWIALLLVILLASERFFHQDYEDGVLEQCLLSRHMLSSMVYAKLLVHWLFVILPLLLLCPLLAILFALSLNETLILFLALMLSTPAMLALCTLAVAFSTGRPQKGILTALILLPLTLPLMIFGSSALNVVSQALPVSAYLAILLAISILALAFLPIAIAAVIRIGLME